MACAMKANRSMISRLSALALGGLLSGAPLAARAEQPTTAAEAQSRADHYSELASKYRLQGGVLYKTGNIQRAEMAAANCKTVAEQLTPAVAVTDISPGVDVMTAAAAQPSDSPHCPKP
jgi:hypothetical protein